jgi:hypothetical protein
MLDHTIEFISDQAALVAMIARISAAPALALDIETINWWDREAERVALVQMAFREEGRPQVAVLDALARLDLELLRQPLEFSAVPKAIHNAVYDAGRLSHHFRIATSPIHDTMLAARRSGERRCSLQAQAETHLGLQLDKSEQRGDWSRRPLGPEQLRYAALDAACTLLLYEHQTARGLRGDYQLRDQTRGRQHSLPLSDAPRFAPSFTPLADPAEPESAATDALSAPALALLGIVTELAGRYSPEQLAASAGSERVGLAGWIIDRALGADADLDESSVRLEIAALIERGLASLSATRRLEATPPGARLWQEEKRRIEDRGSRIEDRG